MSKNKGFSDTAAGRYSLALYELAAEANVLNDVEDHSLSIINLVGENFSKPLIRQFNLGLSEFIVLYEVTIPWL